MRVHVAVLMAAILSACQRETRDLRLDPPALAALDEVALMPDLIAGSPADAYVAMDRAYERNAFQLSQGKRLYTWFNCKGCHADGGGASGPAFLDGWWRYGPNPVSIFVSIRDGRPHGMPPFRDRMTTEQIWQLTGYLQTIGAYSAKTAAPSRNDEMHSRPAESRAPAASTLSDPPSR